LNARFYVNGGFAGDHPEEKQEGAEATPEALARRGEGVAVQGASQLARQPRFHEYCSNAGEYAKHEPAESIATVPFVRLGLVARIDLTCYNGRTSGRSE
jgi:hypothetical protein